MKHITVTVRGAVSKPARKIEPEPEREPTRPAASSGKAKTTISISEETLAYVDQLAATKHTTRSRMIEDLLQEARRREEDELAAEGYRLFSQESEEFAREALPPFWEVVKNEL